MTIGQRKEHQNVSQKRRFVISAEQNGKKQGPVQKGLLKISNVQWDSQKKQWITAGQQWLADTGEKHSLCTEEHQIRSTQKKIMENDRTHSYGQRHLDRSCLKRRKNADSEIDHLLILANSAELLLESDDSFHHTYRNNQSHKESQTSTFTPELHDQPNNTNSTDQKYIERKTDVMDPIEGAENNTFRLLGRIRLSQIRRQARLKNHQLTLETHGNHTHGLVNCQTFEDQRVELQTYKPLRIDVENKKVLCTNGQIRLTQLRREARSRNTHLVDVTKNKNAMKKLEGELLNTYERVRLPS